MSSRGRGCGTRRTREKQVSNIKVLRVCAVRQSARGSVYLCTPVRFVTLRRSSRRRSKTIPHNLICVAATSRPELVLFLEFKTRAGTPDVVGHCDCRHVCDNEESHHEEDLDKSGHEVHDDHWSASGSEYCLVIFPFSAEQPVCIQGVFRSSRCAALILGLVARPCCVLCSKPVLLQKRRKSALHDRSATVFLR